MNRRRLIRLLVGLGVGVPILIEGRTLLGLFGTALFGGEGTPTATPTRAGERVGVGDELLPETAPADTVTEAIVTAGDGWSFVLAVEVENRGDVPYELQVGPVMTAAGDTASGSATTGRIAPGATGEVRGEWEIPSGASPATVIAVARSYGGSTPATMTAEVELADVPVRRR